MQSPASNGGWLGDDDKAKAPSMTEMVDRAIGEEEADDFVDDSWVDEEVGNDEYAGILDEPEGPVTPSPEVGGLFLKLLLVAALVLALGGGVMLMGQEKKTPEQARQEELAKELAFARSSIETGKNYLKDGKALLAIGPLEAAMTSLKTAGGSEKEILSTKATLATALMKSQEYQKAYDHWAGLAKSSAEYKKEGKAQMAECSKLLRAQATDGLAEAVEYIKNGESSSVIDLGKSALKIYEAHQGTASQKGKAWGVMGRGFMNGGEYGKAKDAFKKAMGLNPAGNYGVYISEINAKTAREDYYSGGGGSVAAPAVKRTVVVEARIDSGQPSPPPGVRVVAAPRPRPSTSASAPAPAPVAAPRPVSKPIPAYQPSSAGRRSGGERLGKKGVLSTY
jgi:tetratricopeptide (TPR) repeat protein